MGKETEQTTEDSNASTLVDFLYIDRERLDSFISQRTNGTLRSVTKTIGVSESSSRSGGLSVHVAKGTINKSTTSNEGTSEQYDPFYSQLIDFLNDIQHDPALTISPEDVVNPRLFTAQGTITILDTQGINTVSSLAQKHPKFFNLSGNAKDIKTSLNLVDGIIKSFPKSISINLTLSDDKVVSGPLKESGLQIPASDITQHYGASLPGQWYVFGIFDYAPIDPASINTSGPCDILGNISGMYASTVGSLFFNTPYKVIPIVVFRAVAL